MSAELKKISRRSIVVYLIYCVIFISCNKVGIEFGDDALSEDPNITILDSLTPNIETLQIDSFATYGTKTIIVGEYTDSLFGDYKAGSYIEFNPPSDNLIADCICQYDSLVFRAKPTGGYMGDTLSDFHLNIYPLTKEINLDNGSKGYNVGSFPYNAAPFAGNSFNVRPINGDIVSIKLSNELGKDLFNKLKANADSIKDYSLFHEYFKGVYITGSNDAKNAVYFLGQPEGGFMRLYYRTNDIVPQSKYVDFPLSDSTQQFNGFTYDRSNTPLAVFTPRKRESKNINLTGNTSYMHYNGGLFPKITFPSLFSINELHPYVKVLKAVMEVTPLAGYYGKNKIYDLPVGLYIYNADGDNHINTFIADGTLTGDEIYNKDIKYTFDITTYINSLLGEGRYSQQSIIIAPSESGKTENRLLLNTSSVKLKLYLLGL